MASCQRATVSTKQVQLIAGFGNEKRSLRIAGVVFDAQVIKNRRTRQGIATIQSYREIVKTQRKYTAYCCLGVETGRGDSGAAAARFNYPTCALLATVFDVIIVINVQH